MARTFNQSEEKKIELKRLIAWIEVTIGLTKLRASEYIQTICDAKGWTINNGAVYAGDMQ